MSSWRVAARPPARRAHAAHSHYTTKETQINVTYIRPPRCYTTMRNGETKGPTVHTLDTVRASRTVHLGPTEERRCAGTDRSPSGGCRHGLGDRSLRCGVAARGDHVLCREACGGLRAHHLVYHPPQQLAAACGRRHQAGAQEVPPLAAAGERLSALDLEEHDSKGEDVGGGRRVACVALLLVPCLARDRLAEVADLVGAVAADEDVVRLDVAVHHLVRVDVRQAARHVQRHLPHARLRVRQRQRVDLALHDLAERAVLAQLHLHVEEVRVLPRAVVLGHVRVRRHVVGQLHLAQVLGPLLARVELPLRALDGVALLGPHLVAHRIHLGEAAAAELAAPHEVVVELEGTLRARHRAERRRARILAREEHLGVGHRVEAKQGRWHVVPLLHVVRHAHRRLRAHLG
eukprot:scaffold2438_cov69-Phaeocystis_antarctica.AAC.9